MLGVVVVCEGSNHKLQTAKEEAQKERKRHGTAKSLFVKEEEKNQGLVVVGVLCGGVFSPVTSHTRASPQKISAACRRSTTWAFLRRRVSDG